ncbi:DEAD/DEAH box helicase [Flavobacterium alkalisoli]|uniref:DEAD/DEAH box helicase n=1 Tax=Flavobacterium alkalisoli TaxID=2602769 RepID=UPI003A8E43CF
MKLVLRDYQEDALKSVLKSFGLGNQNILVVMPTGSGKTILFTELCQKLQGWLGDDGAILVLSHMSLLCDQSKEKMNKFYPTMNVGFLRGSDMPSKKDNVIVSTMQSSSLDYKLYEWIKECKKEVKLIVIDECHREFNSSYQNIYEWFPKAKRLSVTASPFVKSKLIKSEYDDVAYTLPMQTLVDRKRLVKPILKTIKFDGKELEKKVALIAKIYMEKELGKKAIIFLPSKMECEVMANTLNDHGIKSYPITASTPEKERELIFNDYDDKFGEAQVLISCDVLTAGWDSYEAEVCFLFCDEDSSVSAYIQRIGRTLRPEDGDSVKPHHDKQTARIYAIGNSPTIKEGFIEKLHNLNYNPDEAIKNAESLEAEIELHELLDDTTSDEYKYKIETARAISMTKKLKMEVVEKYIREDRIPKRYMKNIMGSLEDFASTTGGKRKATQKQIELLNRNGVKIEGATKNEASLLIDVVAKTNNWKTKDDSKWLVQDGTHKGKKVWQLPHAYRSHVKKAFPDSKATKLIMKWEKEGKNGKV